MIHCTAKVSEEVNRKCPARYTTIQLSTPYTNPECHCHILRAAQQQYNQLETAAAMPQVAHFYMPVFTQWYAIYIQFV